MSNIQRWHQDFPGRALDLLGYAEPIAKSLDRKGSLALLIAPALLVAPYERLQTKANRTNPQADFDAYPDHKSAFDMIMDQKLSEADVWEDQAPSAKTWLVTQAKAITSDPAQWTALHEVSGPHDPKFWNGDALNMKTLTVLELLRDALAHWNVATSDNSMRHFNDKYAMNRFFFYRAKSARGPWDVISMPAESFLTFLKGWAALLSGGEGRERLRSREALASSEKNTA